MKNLILIFATVLLGSSIFISCKKDRFENENGPLGILPASFKVDIPDAISYESSGKTNKTRSAQDTLQGGEIYEHLGTFIHVGESAADIVEAIMHAIAVHEIDEAMTLNYQSNEDGRSKYLDVIENVTYDGVTWEFELTIDDVQSAGNADQGRGMQVFWNNTVAKGIAILKPYNIDRTSHTSIPNAMFRIDYSEAGEYGYDKHMIVSISGLPLADPLSDPYSMETLKMFAGKTGNSIDVYGNSNHPNASFFTTASGFNWAFVASGDVSSDLGVAEVGIPPSSLDETSRAVILGDYSLTNVFTDQIYDVWPNIDSSDVAGYLTNTQAPGYFDNSGFVAAGTAPNGNYANISPRLTSLTPYNPIDISGLSVAFDY